VADAPSSPSPPPLVRLGGTPPMVAYVRSLWERRQFAWTTARGELQTQHLDTALGNAWHLINPLLLIAVYFVVFGLVLDITRGLPEGLFLPFLAVGIFTYQYSQKSITGGARTITSNQGLIRSLQFPRALLPLATVIRETLAYGSAFVVMIVVVLLSGMPPRWGWLLILPALALQFVFNTGMTLISARLTDKFRDLENVLPYLFRLAFYGSGVIWAVDGYLENPALRRLFLANPFYVFITIPRHELLVGYDPDYVGWMWVSAVAWAAVAAVVGLFVFRAGEREYGRG
jgi:teichoic acid transport system permease protein